MEHLFNGIVLGRTESVTGVTMPFASALVDNGDAFMLRFFNFTYAGMTTPAPSPLNNTWNSNMGPWYQHFVSPGAPLVHPVVNNFSSVGTYFKARRFYLRMQLPSIPSVVNWQCQYRIVRLPVAKITNQGLSPVPNPSKAFVQDSPGYDAQFVNGANSYIDLKIQRYDNYQNQSPQFVGEMPTGLMGINDWCIAIKFIDVGTGLPIPWPEANPIITISCDGDLTYLRRVDPSIWPANWGVVPYDTTNPTNCTYITSDNLFPSPSEKAIQRSGLPLRYAFEYPSSALQDIFLVVQPPFILDGAIPLLYNCARVYGYISVNNTMETVEPGRTWIVNRDMSHPNDATELAYLPTFTDEIMASMDPLFRTAGLTNQFSLLMAYKNILSSQIWGEVPCQLNAGARVLLNCGGRNFPIRYARIPYLGGSPVLAHVGDGLLVRPAVTPPFVDLYGWVKITDLAFVIQPNQFGFVDRDFSQPNVSGNVVIQNSDTKYNWVGNL